MFDTATRPAPKFSDERTYTCWQCQDDPSGWLVMRRCAGDGSCGRRDEHRGHFWTERCSCWLRKNAEHLRNVKASALQKNKPIPRDCDLLDDLEAGRYRW